MSVYADSIRPSRKAPALAFDTLSIVGGTLFLTLLAQVSIPLGFSPVPLSLQTLGVLLIGAILGSKRGFLTVAAYLFEGGVGLPVFAGWKGGIVSLLGPTGGYLVGFLFCAFFVGYILERQKACSIVRTGVVMLTGTVAILACGVLYLACFVGLKTACFVGLYPFLVGDVIKAVIATVLVPSGWKFLNFFFKNRV